MEDEDFILALQLQEQFNNEALAPSWAEDNDGFPFSKKRRVDSSDWTPVRPQAPMSIVDERWEMLDPSPDVRAMFLQFNDMFFWGKLSGVEVRWSPRMTLCAGVCSYEGRGGLCSIRLSEPLLKLRPRKDLVETLLHEMIHALLFVTQNNRDRDGHGPEFCKHMNRINGASGTNITIYHSFHDEVDVYRQHWWRCDGPCQNRKPFLGYVKRAMNRAPSARDPWWEDHRRTCGGTFTKIKEPENYGKKGKNEEKKDKIASKKTASKIAPASNTAGSGSQDIRNIIPFSGRGFVLGGSSQPSASMQKPPSQSPPPSQRTPEEPAKTSSINIETQSSPIHLDRRISTSSATVLPKRSVSNTKAFININGSPVRITRDNSSLMRPKQRTVQDLFQARSLSSPEKAASTSSATKAVTSSIASNQLSRIPALGSALDHKPLGQPSLCTDCTKTNLFNKSSSNNPVGSKPASAGPLLSKYFGSPKNSTAGTPGSSVKPESSSSSLTANSKHFGSPVKLGSHVPASTSRPFGSPHKSGTAAPGGRKRLRDDRNSAHIFDFFQREVRQSSASASSSERREEGRSAAGTAGSAPHSSSAPSAVAVHCPVCQSQVLESQINEHLDSCLK
ncbi:sprT-like domain-containing protein Spartan [Pygocentrus nattereri]|uniref:sprT-like domain-containing protein Spartan n=1 Tax=Pygocentrus nattereri TaxID=42514 RepID=UPI0018911BFE|nr:sprT-like domain-containing protein Spartan [Pygocentrus nattereri]